MVYLCIDLVMVLYASTAGEAKDPVNNASHFSTRFNANANPSQSVDLSAGRFHDDRGSLK